MSTITFEIHIPELGELAQAIKALLKRESIKAEPVEADPEPVKAAYQELTPEPAPEPAKTAPVVTMDMITAKAIKLVEAGRTADLQQLLKTYSVVGLPQLQPNSFEAFYNSLEAMG